MSNGNPQPRTLAGRPGGTDGRETELIEEIGITETEVRRRKEWLQFEEADVERLRDINPIAREYADDVINQLYDHFMGTPETKDFFKDPATLARVKALQKEYFFKLTQGEYNREYFEDRLRIGAVHGRIGLDPKWYLGAYNLYVRAVGSALFKAYRNTPQKFLDAYYSLLKLTFLDIGLAIDTYIYSRESTIRDQQEAIRELSTPVLQVRPGLLILPLVGVLDSTRARQLAESLLATIRGTRAKVVVMNVTGVGVIDSKVANHLLQTIESARLMGARVIITGLSPEVAQSVSSLGIDLAKLNAVGDLQGGIESAEEYLSSRAARAREVMRAGQAAAEGEAEPRSTID